MRVRIVVPCFGVLCCLIGCANVSSSLNSSEQPRELARVPSTSVHMALDQQEPYQNDSFKCFYVPVSTSTDEQLGVTLHSSECPERIHYDFTKGNWQIAE